jgi:hypothetical protein
VQRGETGSTSASTMVNAFNTNASGADKRSISLPSANVIRLSRPKRNRPEASTALSISLLLRPNPPERPNVGISWLQHAIGGDTKLR